ncbi:tripartite tricarboxylate transporter permease [Pseudochelatococcus sp. B33]
MDALHHLALGAAVSLSLQNLLFCFIGALLGTLIGVLPGIGPIATMALLLPATYALEPVTALIMLAGIYYGSQYGGSTTAILVNLPGESSSVVTTLDGYQMAKKGRAGAALSIAAIGSFAAGIFSTLVIAFAAPALSDVALSFGPVDYFALTVLGLILAVVIARGSVINAIGMALFGLLLGIVGTDPTSGVQRFTFGFYELSDGLDFVSAAIGLFAIAEMFLNVGEKTPTIIDKREIGSLFPSRKEWRAAIPAVARGSLIGSLLGILPGGGALLASFAAYGVEKKVAKDPSRFGQGAIAGVAGPESANNAAAQTSFIPLLTLGIPSNALMALMAGAMIIHEIQPGPGIMLKQPDLVWGLIVSMLVGNLMLVLLNLPLIGIWVKILQIPYRMMFPAIVIFSCIGAYSLSNNTFEIYCAVIFSILGVAFKLVGCEPAPLILGFILGPMMEEYFRRAMLLSRGDPAVFLSSPISASCLIAALVIVIFSVLPAIRKKREIVFVED